MKNHFVISIVDDDSVVREAIADLVQSMGFEAVTFKSGEDFLASGLAADTACVITDLQMPGLNGFDLQECLLSEGYATPVIFITAFPNPRARERASKLGAIAFLSKPFQEAALTHAIRTVVVRAE